MEGVKEGEEVGEGGDEAVRGRDGSAGHGDSDRPSGREGGDRDRWHGPKAEVDGGRLRGPEAIESGRRREAEESQRRHLVVRRRCLLFWGF